MSTDPATVAQFPAHSRPLETRAGAVFGQYRPRCADQIIALVCDDRQLTGIGTDHAQRSRPTPLYPGAAKHYRVSAEHCAESERVREFPRWTADVLVRLVRRPGKRAAKPW